MARPRELAPISIPNHIASQVAGMSSFAPPPFTPALPSALQQSFSHPFAAHGPLPLHTPIQQYFQQQPPPPGRPSHHVAASIAHFPAPGIHLPSGLPVTPMGGHFPRPSVGGAPFPGRNRRQPSIGGPPKAVLGGPARKLSPLPPPVSTTPGPKTKKVAINLPAETVEGEGGTPPTRPAWARAPLDYPFEYIEAEVSYPEAQTRESYPPEADYALPPTIDVFLPGKALWEPLKNRVIEEKLDKMGIEKGSGSTVPHIFAPHARAASISSPADPALLFFKLNKLQQAQSASASNSNSTSPQPPFMTPSPQLGGQFYSTNRHGHSFSLAQPVSQPFFDQPLETNSFVPHTALGNQAFEPPTGAQTYPTLEGLQAAQAQTVLNGPSLVPPTAGTRPSSRPDFIRGFGLDIPEEEEPEEEPYQPTAFNDDKMSQTTEDDRAGQQQQEAQGPVLPVRSTVHSRHASKLSAALSLVSVGGPAHDSMIAHPVESDMDAVAEWTGSEDLYEISDDESIGEWSNPSDEERARQQRAERRSQRRAARAENEPRRLPNFPRPPENTISMPLAQDDDVISNPSDDGLIPRTALHPYLSNDMYNRPSSSSTGGRSPRPLPPLPHSRMPSAQLSLHDPAQAHSRAPSVHEAEQKSAPRPATEALNPFAKPFVFGARDSIWAPQAPVSAATTTHSRLPSMSKPLSAAAPEFKPGNFTFRPPAGVPHLAFPEPAPAAPRPLPEIPEPPARAQQGREKRQRRDSGGSVHEGDSMQSFRFPNPDAPIRQVESPEPIKPRHTLNPAATPFTFGRMSREAFMSKENIPVSVTGLDEETLHDDAINKEDSLPKIPLADASSPEPKSASTPVHLDYRHPVSQNTVPAGLFKALVNNGDERTRRTVRSRLGSREIFEGLRRPSLDELHVESISGSRYRLVTDPGIPSDSDVFAATHVRRRSSLPNSLHSHSPVLSLSSPDPMPAVDFTGRFEQNKYEDKLEAMLDTKLAVLRKELSSQKQAAQGLSPTTEAMIAEVVSLFRSQLHESAVRGLDESQMDARGELDFEMFKDVVQQGNEDALHAIRSELQQLAERVTIQSSQLTNKATLEAVEGVSSRAVDAVKTTVSQMSSQSKLASKELVDQINSTIASLRPEPIDYDALTARLSQAVKPHISQLIDLASDKRETAGLIVDRILPMLPRSSTPKPSFDTDALILKLVTEVRRAIAPIDAFEIKEQVADLVIERLDSRLAVRDKAFNAESIAAKVTEGISQALKPIGDLVRASHSWSEEQQSLVASNTALTNAQNDLHALLREIPSRIDTISDALQTFSTSSSADALDAVSSVGQGIDSVKSLLEQVLDGQRSLTQKNEEIFSRHTPLLEDLPTRVETLVNAAFEAQRELASAQTKESDELRKANTDYQVQLAKARGAHGQVRVEKDVVSERLKEVDADRDRLRAQVKELQMSLTAKTSEVTSWEAKAFKLEQALGQALNRLQGSDVDQQSTKERIAALETSIRDATAEKHALAVKVENLEGQLKLANQENETLSKNMDALRDQNAQLSSQQSHWDHLRQAAEKIDQLTNLFGQTEIYELAELRDIRDRNKALSAEHGVLQKRFKDLESKSIQNDQTLAAIHTSLNQAQQRSSDWEKRAQEFEGQLELTQTKLEQSEHAYAQLDTDYSMLKLQLEEKLADERLVKDRERHLRHQIAALETKMKRLQTELLQAKSSRTYSPTYRNGIITRPDSRSSTVIVDYRDDQALSTGTATPPNQASVWDSMHAPSTNGDAHVRTPVSRQTRLPEHPTPKAKVYDPRAHLRQSIASPTPSVMSVATLGEDGWWE